MNFNWQSFKEEEFVVQCNTEEKAINFLNECENQGLNVLDSMKSGDHLSLNMVKTLVIELICNVMFIMGRKAIMKDIAGTL